MYHQLLRRPRPDHTFFSHAITPEQFRNAMEHLKRHYQPMSMEQMCHTWYHGRRWPRRAVLVTFDDGLRNNLWAARILHELGMSGTFFVPSDVVDTRFVPANMRYAHILSTRRGDVFDTPIGQVDFRDRQSLRRWAPKAKDHLLMLTPQERDALLEELGRVFDSLPFDAKDPDYHYLTSAELREMVALGMTIGGHGATHEALHRCADDELQRELVESREKLGALVGRSIDVLAYPDGRFNQRVLELTARHYRLAFAATDATPASHPHAYPRRGAGADVAAVLGRWYPLKRKCIRLAKRVLGYPIPGEHLVRPRPVRRHSGEHL